MKTIAVLGTGAWGTALALTAHRAGHSVFLIGRNPRKIERIQRTARNEPYLPDITLPDSLIVTDHLNLVEKSDLLLMVTPAQHTREACHLIAPFLPTSMPVVLCSKGIEQAEPNCLMSQVTETILPNPLCVLSGPNLALEVAQNKPAATTISCQHQAIAQEVAETLRHAYFRCYVNTDVIGVQVAGAVKNVLAIACGIVHGRNMGYNASAGLVTRGLAEMGRLATALGGRPETLLGLAGVGDLMLTCFSHQSRNTSLGIALGSGQELEDVLNKRASVTEGVFSAQSLHRLSHRFQVKMPICDAVYRVLYEQQSIDQAIDDLLARPLTTETM
jgi:glycerol-3-phosphate dehydrogenase (NAD(P)+)